MHHLSASLLISALSSSVLAQPATTHVKDLRTSTEWVDAGQSVLLKCDSSPTDACSFEVRLTGGPQPGPASAAAGKSVKVFIGSQGASYCASAVPFDARTPVSCKFISAGFHY